MKFASLFVLIFSITCSAAEPNTSAIWKQYLEQKKSAKTTWLPDFSYAGYKRGEQEPKVTGKIFNVKDYGALPDDLKDDRLAISRAVKAAEKNGGGIVLFQKGRYLVNTSMENRGTIRIESDNIIIKGAGSTKGGTIIHSIHPYGGGDPHKLQRLHLGQNVFLIHSRHEEKPISKKKAICKIRADTPRETFSVTVDSTKNLKIDDYVYLYALNNKIFEEMIKPYTVDKKWTTITKNKAYTAEIHKIKSIGNNYVTFFEPVRYDIKQKHNWVLKECKPIKNVGVEDICFMGNASHRYKHHRSGMDDSGWSFIKMKGVADSWVRRCTFINSSQTVYVALSSSVSVLNIIVAGNKGHHIPRTVFLNYGYLGGLILDRAGFNHGPSLSWGTVSTVFWRCTSKGSIDCHAGRPYVSLFDNISGGKINSSGGIRDYPQHLRFLVIWNFNHMLDKIIKYDFWRKNKNNCFVKPIIVGFHGKNAVFAEDKLEILESLGQRVKPDSLYEAQLKLRLGKLPEWVDKAKQEYARMIKKELPRHYSKDSKNQYAFIYREKFQVAEMLKYLSSLSLQMHKSIQFTYSVNGKGLQLDSDQGFVRKTLYSLMNCIYRYTRYKNSIMAQAVNIKGKSYIRFIVKSGKFKKQLKAINNDIDLKYARIFVKKVNGNIKFVKGKNSISFEVLVPQTLK